MNETSDKQRHDDSSVTACALREIDDKEREFVKEFEMLKVIKSLGIICRVKYI